MTFNGYAQYKSGPNSLEYPGIPKGKMEHFTLESQIYPNTVREVSVYIPAQYKEDEPAALMIFQDGHAYLKSDGDFNVPVVFDNLISQKKMPVTIAVFINPGHDKSIPTPDSPWRVSNRSIEYDSMDKVYGDFLIKEVLPKVSEKYRISDDPKMRAICGLSSGAICAFSVAWHHNHSFSKVLSHIGSYTNIRGGHNYPALIRSQEKRNIKIYLQDGSNDLDNQFGNWWLANQQMASALHYRDYEYKFVTGNGGHNGNHGGSILPQSLEWLWSDTVKDLADSKVYTVADGRLMINGPTYHYDQLRLETLHLKSSKAFLSNDKEQMFIIRKGNVLASLNGNEKELPANSIICIMPGDKLLLEPLDGSSEFYHLEYISNQIERNQEEKSFMVNFSEVEYKPHDKGGIRNYFKRKTQMCDYYEMHITNLNSGIKSHEPHAHEAAEIVIMIEGETEMEIGNEIYKGRAGDVYFLGANVPHAIKNIGNNQCMYFAYQWTTPN